MGISFSFLILGSLLVGVIALVVLVAGIVTVSSGRKSNER